MENQRKNSDRIREVLIKWGIKRTTKGFIYLNSLISTLMERGEGDDYFKIVELYEEVGKEFDTSAANIEISIRNAISRRKRQTPESGAHITNKEFVAQICDYLSKPVQ